MQALIVGADRVDTIRTEVLRVAEQFGIKGVDHWPGRKASESRRNIPQRTALVIFVCDRANHMMMKNVRKQAESLGIPMVFCRHSATEVRERLGDRGKGASRRPGLQSVPATAADQPACGPMIFRCGATSRGGTSEKQAPNNFRLVTCPAAAVKIARLQNEQQVAYINP